MYVQYPILIEAPSSDQYVWGVIVPDMPGCFSAADEAEDILKNTREAIALWLEATETIPTPSPVKEVIKQAKKQGLQVALVDVDVSAFEGPKKRINVMLSKSLLSRIDSISDNRSAFLAEAALAKLGENYRSAAG